MTKLNLYIPESFLTEETRCNYFISRQMKEVWAVQLDLLSQLQRVCEKYSLNYFADSGTLIGAVRHKGFIPWDDDIDIVMKREDYTKLLEIGDKEFSAPYLLQNAYSDNFMRGFSRLRNIKTTALTKYDLDKDYNHGIFIDIFPLDNLPDNKILRKIWIYRIKALSRIMVTGLYRKPESTCSFIKRIFLKYLNEFFHNTERRIRYFKHYEKICQIYNDKDTENISYVAYSHGMKKHIWSSNSFLEHHDVPFEFLSISIPDGYDSRLKVEYGDYMTIKRVPTRHGGIVFDTEIPYDEFIKENDKTMILDWLDEKGE